MRTLIFIALMAGWTLPAHAAPLKAVATFSIVGDMVRQVGGDQVEVTVLVGPDGDVHTFEPGPQESQKLAQAQLVFEIGLHFEPWLAKMYAASGSSAKRVVLSEGIEPIESTPGQMQDVDPHIWLDVSNAMVMVEHIRDGLIEADAAHKAVYDANVQKYLQDLGRLDDQIIEALQNISDEGRKLVTSHDTFGYFARRYGFKVIGTALGSATTEAADPSAAAMAEIIDRIKAEHITVVFVENMHNPKFLQSIAADAHIKVAPALYTDALGPAGSPGESYLKMMEYNARILAENLS